MGFGLARAGPDQAHVVTGQQLLAQGQAEAAGGTVHQGLSGVLQALPEGHGWTPVGSVSLSDRAVALGCAATARYPGLLPEKFP